MARSCRPQCTAGFISVENDTVSLLAEVAELVTRDRRRPGPRSLETALATAVATMQSLSAAQSRAETRLRAAEARI